MDLSEVAYHCPNCDAHVGLTAEGCASCGASFRGPLAWKPRRQEDAKQPQTLDQWRRHVSRWLIVCSCLFLGGVIALKSFEREHWLSLLPSELKVTKVLYAQDQSWGFGPGGNETGVVLYELPDRVAERLHGRNAASLADSHQAQDWKSTPLRDHLEWIEGLGALAQVGPVPMPRLHNFLNRYGFGISIDPSIMDGIDKAISEPGNFYAYTRTGVLLVMPAQRRVAFVFAG